MFERRLKIFLLLIFAGAALLLGRAVQIQGVQHADLRQRAVEFNTRPQFVETVRGRILDVKGRELAVDVPCIDAMVTYQAIPHEPDPKWLLEQAGLRLARRMGEEYTRASRSKKESLRKAEVPNVLSDLGAMWKTLATCPGMDEAKIEDIRQSIVRRVENRRRWVWYSSYQNAVSRHEKKDPDPWYVRWMLDNDKPPTLDEFRVTVQDEVSPHPVLRAIDQSTVAMLGKQLDRFPGLSLQPSTHRHYPYGSAGCHWIGTVAAVTREDREKDPFVGDELRRYDYNDLIGRGGVEALAEPRLRGARGKIVRDINTNAVAHTTSAEIGRDVRVSIDIDLQQTIESIFPRVKIKDKEGVESIHKLHGAVVVLDVPTGQVRAMVSYPTFDLNELDQNYPGLVQDRLTYPLLNRATMSTLEPGSTVKPLVGLWGMKSGVMGLLETIECTGFMTINGRPITYAGKCWVARRLANTGLSPKHHPIPQSAPHPTGFLTFADAIERSCNPFFETIAERLGMSRLSEGFMAFGLGVPTGVGIGERAGMVPSTYRGRIANPLGATWSAGIGQGLVQATPLQIANAFATIARHGEWVRPTLIADDVPPGDLRPVAYAATRPARMNLHLPPEAIQMAHDGMWNVVHGRAGTGKELRFTDAAVCGKTGTAQASRILIDKLDADGQPVYQRDEQGNVLLDRQGKPKVEKEPLALSTKNNVNPIAPWYLGTGQDDSELAHAWYVGFAPRDNPKIAFCVFVEYGGSGGITAASIANETLAACVEHGYLRREK